MASPILVIIAIVMVILIIYAFYTYVLQNGQAPSKPITIAPTSVPTNSMASNSMSNSMKHGAFHGNVITIYENDILGTNPIHSITPATVNVLAGTNISFLVINNGLIPHSLRITGYNFNVSLNTTLLPGQNAMLNFTAPLSGNFLIFSQHPGDQALGLNATMNIVYNQT